MFNFLKNAFKDIKESAAAQHEVDKANFAAVKAESRANFYEAKRNGSPEAHKKAMAEKRNLEKSAAEERIKKAEEKIKNL